MTFYMFSTCFEQCYVLWSIKKCIDSIKKENESWLKIRMTIVLFSIRSQKSTYLGRQGTYLAQG